ncbi:hypothetical protein S40293_04257 [Stachybotrys chartarum IBT 40293]|nr:hypothetical protein S40293_04257 [Stachybotrys chartarum IBT 40293]
MPSIQPREAPQHEHHGLDLGWLLALSIGGAVLLLLAVGLLLSWRFRKQRPQQSSFAHALSNMRPARKRDYPTKLTTYHGLGSEHSGSRVSSRVSLQTAPILPPLPAYHGTVESERGRPLHRAYSEEEEQRIAAQRGLREGWFARESWIPKEWQTQSLAGEERVMIEETWKDDVGKEQEIHILKRQNRTMLNPSLTEPVISLSAEPPRGRSRAAAQHRPRPSVSDNDLQDILRSIEQRLKDGKELKTGAHRRASSSSPVKAPTNKANLNRTSHVRQVSTPIRVVPPSPTPDQAEQNQFQKQSKRFSEESTGAVARRLIAQATREVEKSECSSRYSHMSDSESQEEEEEEEEEEEDVNEQERSSNGDDARRGHSRSQSAASNASSSLSTLYSVENGDETVVVTRDVGHEPLAGEPGSRISFVEPRLGAKGPRILRRQNPSSRIASMKAVVDDARNTSTVRLVPQDDGDEPRVRGPEEPRSPRATDKTISWPLKTKLQPPETFRFPGCAADVGATVRPVSPSGSSIKTVSNNDSDSDSQHSSPEEAPMRWRDDGNGRSRSPSPSPPSVVGDASSSPLFSSPPNDKHDILSLLLSQATTSRTLPDLPSDAFADGDVFPTPLSPRPKTPVADSNACFATPPPRQTSVCSVSSSAYSKDSVGDLLSVAVASGHHRQSPVRAGAHDPIPVGDTIAALRRMNSRLSTYSNISQTSTAAGDLEPSRPARRSGSISPTRPSSRYYLNLSGGNPNRRSPVNTQKVRRNRASPVPATPVEGTEERSHGKENRKPSTQATTPGLRESGSGGNISRESSQTRRGAKMGLAHGVERENGKRSRRKRDSMESLGLYDADGFLRYSPDRDQKYNKSWRI